MPGGLGSSGLLWHDGAAVAAVAIALAVLVVDVQGFREATFLEFIDAKLPA